LKYFFALVLFALLPFVSWAQYKANATTAAIPYPGTIPCPARSCSSGGSVAGANYTLTPSDFGNAVTRVTDYNTLGATNSCCDWSYNGDAYVNPFDATDTRFVLYSDGNLAIPMQWNGSTLTATKLYGAGYYMATPFPRSSVTFSYIQPYIGYALGINGSNDPAIYSFNFSSSTSAPVGVQITDLATCAPALAGLGFLADNDLIVSKDDQTFGIELSTTSGQGSAGNVYVVVWNRTNGCRVWETDNGAVTGAWGATGTINMPDRFTLHDAVLNPSGAWMYVQYNTCLAANKCSTGTNSGIQGYFWNISTLNVTGNNSYDACGHVGLGYSTEVNLCFYGSGYNSTTWYQRPMNAPNTTPPTGVINSGSPIGAPSLDQHTSWTTDNPFDTAPFCASTETGTFAVTYPYDNEIDCVAMDGSGTIWRFGHTYSTHLATNFEAQNSIGGVSADGQWFLWTSDWDGMLGNTSGASNACTLRTNCRNDVFIMALPQSKFTTEPAPPTGLSAVIN
jgi:hypothetical protein